MGEEGIEDHPFAMSPIARIVGLIVWHRELASRELQRQLAKLEGHDARQRMLRLTLVMVGHRNPGDALPGDVAAIVPHADADVDVDAAALTG